MAKPVAFERDLSLPELGQAVSLALALLKHFKVRTTAELVFDDSVVLDPDQRELLSRHEVVLSYLRHKLPGGPDAVGMCLCPACGRWQLVAASAPAACTLTTRCEGRPVKIVAAGKAHA